MTTPTKPCAKSAPAWAGSTSAGRRTAFFYIWRGEKTAHVPTPKDCTDSYGYRRLCKKLRRSYFLPMIFLVVDIWLVYFLLVP